MSREMDSYKYRKISESAQKACDTDDPIETVFYEPIAIRLACFFAGIGWSANRVTFLSLLFGAIGSFLFVPHSIMINLLGISCEIAAAVLDCADGQLARMTHTSSQLGRFLDGFADVTVFIFIYVSVGIRTMNENIPFTETRWSYLIIPVMLAVMLCHSDQARMADYFKGVHLSFIKGFENDSLALSGHIEKEISALDKSSPLYEKAYLRIYLIYTRAQERRAPKTFRLVRKADSRGAPVPAELSKAYVSKSHRSIYLTKILAFNVRAYSLFIFMLTGFTPLYFVFTLVVLEGVNYFMIRKYEDIATEVYGAYF